MNEYESDSAVLDLVESVSADRGSDAGHRQRKSCEIPAVVWEVLVDGRLSASPPGVGVLCEVGPDSVVLKLDRSVETGQMAAGLERGQDGRQFVGVSERRRESCDRGVRVTGTVSGVASRLLTEESRLPVLDPDTFQYTLPFDDSVYESWCDAGILRPETLDRVLTCPKCTAVATFRFACKQCGSGRVQHAMLMHHFACAFVAPADQFQQDGTLACPNCRTPHLVAGTDFEYMPGDNQCRSFGSTDRDLTQTGHCLNCDRRFPAHQAIEQELVGYDAQRLDVLALTADLG